MKSLLARLLILVAVAVMPTLAFQAYNEHTAQRVRKHLIEDEAVRLLRLVSAEQQRIAEGAEQVLDVLASALAVQDMTRPICQRLMRNLLKSAPRYSYVDAAGLDGTGLCTPGLTDRPFNASDRAWFKLALQTESFVVGNYEIGRWSGKPSIHFARTFKNADGITAGVVEVALSLEWLNDQLASLDLPSGAIVSISDRNGTFLARWPGGLQFAGRPQPPAIQRLLGEDHALIVSTKSLDTSRPVLVAISPPGAVPQGFLIGVGLDEDTMFAATTQANRAGLLMIGAGMLLALALTAVLGTRLIRRPVAQLIAAAEQWRTGALFSRTGFRHDDGEFGQLATAFDEMAQALEARETALRNALESTTDTVFVLDRDWRYTYLNERAKTQFALGRDLIGQVIWDVFPEATANPFGETYRKAMESGLPTHADAYYVPLNTYWEVHAYPSNDGLTVFSRDVTEQRRTVAALRESEALFRAAFDQAAVGMALAGADETTLRVNDKLCEILGYPREELLGSTGRDFTHPDDRVAEQLHKDAILAGEARNFALTKRSVRKDGTIVWVSLIGTPVRDAPESPVRLFGVIEDITERKRVEAALTESEERLRLAMEAARLKVREFDFVTGLGSWSPDAAMLFGPNDSGMTLDTWLATIHPDDQAHVRGSWDRAVSSPEYDYAAEYRSRQPDGSWRWIAAHARMVFVAGRAVRAISVAQDVTERKHAQEALQESETRLQLAREAAGFGVWDWDIVTGKRVWSEEQWRLYGYEPQPGAPSTEAWRSRLHPDDVKRISSEFAAALADPARPLDTHYRVLRADGLVRWLMVKAKVLRGPSGDALRMVGLAMDVTESRETEADLRRLSTELEARVREEVAAREAAQERAAHAERMQALGQLAGGIAHDFNNVLQAVSGAISLIERRPGDVAGIRRMAKLATEAINRGASITRRLLAFGRRGDLRAVAIEPAALLSDLREILVHTLGANIDVQISLGNGLRAFLADKGQLETSLINLATNARDAMEAGGKLILSAAVEVVASPAAGQRDGLDPGRYVRLIVQDTGVGMDAATLARASEPFFTTKKLGAGTGLGLAMTKGFAEQSGGGMRVESSPGEGTTVTLWLPETDPDAVAKPENTDRTISSRRDGSVRVLLVDDESAVRDVLALHLEDAGYAVLAAASGTEALSLLAAGESVDAMVTDLSMPGLDGLGLIRAVQKLDLKLPTILLTGYAGDGVALAAGGAIEGTFTLLRKPVRGDQLADTLDALLVGADRDGAGERATRAEAESDGVSD